MLTETATGDQVSMHWSKPWTDYLGLTPASSFLAIVVLFNLISYLKSLGYLTHPPILTADHAIPLLHYTIPRTKPDRYIYSALKPEMVELLLQAKENPNAPCPEISPYQQALNFANHLFIDQNQRLQALEFLVIMLDYGADP